MPRITPDQFDQLVWTMSETSGNYRNTGQFQPNNATTDLTIVNSMVRTGTGILFPNCVQIPGNSNFPTGSSATRNNVIGANAVTVPVPITVSCWVNLRSYHTDQNQTILAKEYRNPSLSGNTWVAPFNNFMIGTGTGNGGGDWFVSVATSASTNGGWTVTDFPIPIGVWSHIGFTIDSNLILRQYLNGCQMFFYSGSTQIFTQQLTGYSYTDGTNGFGPWRVGAIQSTGSGNKEEGNCQVQDIRVANIARPLNYFQKVYSSGALPLQTGTYISTQYYKLRAYDLACSTPTSVVWIDTQVSLANAPAFPCGGPYSSPEVLDTWFQ
jgi:concanavalin A-like lectin/glucanase superfamily protein